MMTKETVLTKSDDTPGRLVPLLPDAFEGRWRVVAGTVPGENSGQEFVVLEPLDISGSFRLRYESEGSERSDFEQEVRFNPGTQTLDSDPSDCLPQRSISMWSRALERGRSRSYIFAIRQPNWQDCSLAPQRERCMPFEARKQHDGRYEGDPDNGTWGAEDGRPLRVC